MRCGKLSEQVVQQPVPSFALLRGQRIGEDIGPRREDLAIDAGTLHALEAARDRLDELREERADLEAVFEAQALLAGRLVLDEAHAIARAFALEHLEQLERNVMRVHVDWHRRGCRITPAPGP